MQVGTQVCHYLILMSDKHFKNCLCKNDAWIIGPPCLKTVKHHYHKTAWNIWFQQKLILSCENSERACRVVEWRFVLYCVQLAVPATAQPRFPSLESSRWAPDGTGMSRAIRSVCHPRWTTRHEMTARKGAGVPKLPYPFVIVSWRLEGRRGGMSCGRLQFFWVQPPSESTGLAWGRGNMGRGLFPRNMKHTVETNCNKKWKLLLMEVWYQ